MDRERPPLDLPWLIGPLLCCVFIACAASSMGIHLAWVLPATWVAGFVGADWFRMVLAARERRGRYEDRNFPTIFWFFWISVLLKIVSSEVLIAGYWDQLVAPGGPWLRPLDEMPQWVHAAAGGCMLVAFLLSIFTWEMYSRSRMVVDNAGGVWLRGRTVYRFRLDEVASWCQVITGDSEGESSRIELTLSDGQSLLIEGNTVEDFIQGFVDFLPNKQGLTSRCT